MNRSRFGSPRMPWLPAHPRFIRTDPISATSNHHQRRCGQGVRGVRGSGRKHVQYSDQSSGPLEPEASVAFLEGEGEDAVLVVIGRSINIHLHMATFRRLWTGKICGMKRLIPADSSASSLKSLRKNCRRRRASLQTGGTLYSKPGRIDADYQQTSSIRHAYQARS